MGTPAGRPAPTARQSLSTGGRRPGPRGAAADHSPHRPLPSHTAVHLHARKSVSPNIEGRDVNASVMSRVIKQNGGPGGPQKRKTYLNAKSHLRFAYYYYEEDLACNAHSFPLRQ